MPASARIAVVVMGDTVRAYLCSGDLAFNGANARWFAGKIADNAIEAASPDGRTLKAKLADGALSLIVTAGEKSFTADAKMVASDDPAGLYRQEASEDDDTIVTGWIVDAEGKTVGNSATVKAKQNAVPPKLNNAFRVGNNFQLNITTVRIAFANLGGQFNEQVLEAKWQVTKPLRPGNPLPPLLTPAEQATIKSFKVTWTLEHPETNAPTEVKNFDVKGNVRLHQLKTAGTSFADRTRFTVRVTMTVEVKDASGKPVLTTVTATKTDFFQIL